MVIRIVQLPIGNEAIAVCLNRQTSGNKNDFRGSQSTAPLTIAQNRKDRN
jgi:hypothetical protein